MFECINCSFQKIKKQGASLRHPVFFTKLSERYMLRVTQTLKLMGPANSMLSGS